MGSGAVRRVGLRLVTRRATNLLIWVALLLSGCGNGQTAGSPTPQSTASPSATLSPAAEPLIVLADPDRVAPPNQQILLRVIRLNGSEVTHYTLRAGVEVLAASGNRIFVFSSGHLKTVERDGSVVDLGVLGTNSPGRVVPSPDGTRWLWSTYTVTGSSVHSVVHLGGDGLPSRVVEEATEDVHVLEPFAWTSHGVFVQHSPMGIGGYILFSPAFGPVDRLDPVTWTAVAEARTTTCSFSDEAADGTIACLLRGPQKRQLALIKSGGSQKTIDLPLPQYTQAGDAYFDPTGTRVVIGGATGVGPPNEQFSTGLINVGTGVFTAFGPGGIRPAMERACWLADGRLVLWRPSHAAGGPAGIYLADRAGQGALIPTNAVAVGQLAAP